MVLAFDFETGSIGFLGKGFLGKGFFAKGFLDMDFSDVIEIVADFVGILENGLRVGLAGILDV